MIERENFISTRETSETGLSEEMDDIFSQLEPGQVEQFYKHYQIWLKQRRLALVQLQVSALQEAIKDNAELMQRARPSAIALAALSQLQACGVDDIDLLDRMLERGDTWLDQAMELLGQCERMGFINDGYTLWCENALDGAFDWLVSMNEAINETAIADSTATSPSPEAVAAISETLKEVTEDLLLQKLMSEDEEETKKRPAITTPLVSIENDFFSSLPVVPLPAHIEDFFSSLPVVPLPTHIEDFFGSLPTVPQLQRRIEEIETLDDAGSSEPTETIMQEVPSTPQDSPSQELFVIASLHATPLPAQAPVLVEIPTSSKASPDVYAVISAPEQEIVSSSSDSEAVTTAAASTYEDSGVTESIPRVSIGARVRPEQPEDYLTDATEKMPVAEDVPVVLASSNENEPSHGDSVSGDSSSWKWKELTQYEMSVARTDVLTREQQEKYEAAPKPARKIGFFRRLLNWLLGRTPDY